MLSAGTTDSLVQASTWRQIGGGAVVSKHPLDALGNHLLLSSVLLSPAASGSRASRGTVGHEAHKDSTLICGQCTMDPVADMMAIGRHCRVEGCHQLDFLPFKCSGCDRFYCLEHRTSCACGNQAGSSVLVCPLCARSIVCDSGADVELVFDRHTRTDCDPSNYERVHRKPRCPVGGCKAKLTSVNSYTCRDCAATVCLKHRLPADHKCASTAGRAAAAAGAAQGRISLSQSFRRMFIGGNGSAGSNARVTDHTAGTRPTPAAGGIAGPSLAQKTAAAALKTRDSIQQQLQQYRRQQQQQAGAAAGATSGSNGALPSATSAAPELCQCGARFATVQQLIEHAEAAHPNGWSSGSIGARNSVARHTSGFERCPHCGREFSDPVQLVAHVEQQHSAATSTCVCS